MQLFAGVAQLEHLSGNYDTALRGELGQSIHHGVKRLWIGIVTIVDDGNAIRPDYLTTLVCRSRCRQRVEGIAERYSFVQGDRERRQRVINIVPPQQGQLRRRATGIGHDIEKFTLDALRANILGAEVCRMFNAVHQHLAVEIAPELGDVGVIGIQHGGAAHGKGGDQLIFSAGNIGNGPEKSQVHRRDIGDNASFRVRDARQRRDLAGMRHSQLHDSDVVFRFETQQLQRQSEVVIEIAL